MEQNSNIVHMEKIPSVYVEEIADEIEDNTETEKIEDDKPNTMGETVIETNIQKSPTKDMEDKRVTFDNEVIYEKVEHNENANDDSDSDDSSDSESSDSDSDDSDSDDSDSDDSDLELDEKDKNDDEDEIINLEEPKQDEQGMEETFEYGDVMDGSHTPQEDQIDMDEDIGGKSVASLAMASGIVGGSLVMKNKRRNIIITGVIISGVIAIVSYLIWKKITEMKEELKRVELQQNMVLNDKDVEVITLDTIEGYIREQQNAQEYVDEDEETTETSDFSQSIPTKLDTIVEEPKLVEVKIEKMPKSIIPPTRTPIVLDGADDSNEQCGEIFEDAIDNAISIEDDLSEYSVKDLIIELENPKQENTVEQTDTVDVNLDILDETDVNLDILDEIVESQDVLDETVGSPDVLDETVESPDVLDETVESPDDVEVKVEKPLKKRRGRPRKVPVL